MGSISVVLQQLAAMSLYMGVGFALCRTKAVTADGSTSMTNLLVYVVLPATIIHSFAVERSAQNTRDLLISFGLGALSLGISVALSALIFKKDAVCNFAAAFSNAGFIGIPLITAAIGQQAVFYIAGMVALLNILQWTYGQYILSGKTQKAGLLSALRNPLTAGVAMGLLRYFVPLNAPRAITGAVAAIAACNAPLAMILLGVLMGNIRSAREFLSLKALAVSFVRLLLIPAVTVLLLGTFPGVSHELRFAVILAAAAPVGANVVVYAHRQGIDSTGATVVTCISTLLSLVTVPAIVLLTAAIW